MSCFVWNRPAFVNGDLALVAGKRPDCYSVIDFLQIVIGVPTM